MKKLFAGFSLLIVTLAVIGMAPFFGGLISRVRFAIAPCSKPISYALGSFNSRFGISEKDFLSAAGEAEAIWEKPFGKDLFVYAPKNTAMKINLVYDYRQQATSKLAGIGVVVDKNQASYNLVKTKYDAKKAEYAELKNQYEAEVAIFNAKSAEYERRVRFSNARGGASRNEYAELEAERAELEAEAGRLQAMQDRLNNLVDEVNALVVALNRLGSELNLSVETYNTIGGSRGETFEEGLYVSTASGQYIDIYEFSTRKKLVRVLAHEFGHALGLEHVDDPKAIMYKLNQENALTATKADIAALSEQCGTEGK